MLTVDILSDYPGTNSSVHLSHPEAMQGTAIGGYSEGIFLHDKSKPLKPGLIFNFQKILTSHNPLGPPAS